MIMARTVFGNIRYLIPATQKLAEGNRSPRILCSESPAQLITYVKNNFLEILYIINIIYEIL